MAKPQHHDIDKQRRTAATALINTRLQNRLLASDSCMWYKKTVITMIIIILTSMAPKPLDILRKCLANFSEKIKDHKDKLNAKLSRKETISLTDEQWLDHEANMVDEHQVLDILEAASDYERGLAWLDGSGKAIVKRLRE